VDLDLVFLGTAGSMPTAQRAPAAMLVRRGGERLLFDCAEGTQRQLLVSIGLIDLREVFLTHYHADHYLGLPGMLKTFSLRGREVPITIYGPPGIEELFTALRRIFGKLTYPHELVTLQPGQTLERGDYRIDTFAVEHRVSAIGYSLVENLRAGEFDNAAAERLGIPAGPERGALQRGESIRLADGSLIDPTMVLGPPRPGRKLVIAADTAPSPLIVAAARDADVLVHEATFCQEEVERARETAHSTALEAAGVAKDADVAMLALTHISSRYSGAQVAREARTVFAETVVPRDFDIIAIPFKERGGPRLVKGGALHRPPEAVPEVKAAEPVPSMEESPR
jgi:ribonuclease Z